MVYDKGRGDLPLCDGDRGELWVPFIDELRKGFDSGLTGEQMSVVLNLVLMVVGLMNTFEPSDVSDQCVSLLGTISRDIKRKGARK